MRKTSFKPPGKSSTASRLEMQKEPPNPQSTIYSNDPEILAILLKTPEVKCVIQALDLLYDLILENRQIGKQLLQKGILDDIYSLPKNNYPYYNGCRYRFLSKIYKLYPETRRKMRRATYFVHMAMEDALKTDDTPLLAYSLEYVSLMTDNNFAFLKSLSEIYDMSKIFTHFLTDPDVDVQNNALALLKNLTENSRTVKRVPDLDNFRLDPLIAQAACPYPDIQNKALDVLDKLTAWEGKRRQWLQEIFSNAAGIDLLLTLLFIFQWRDVHGKCLKILLNLVENTMSLLNLDAVQGITRLVKYLGFIEDEELKAKAVEILLKIAKFEEGRLVLIQNDAIPAFVNLLEKKQDETLMKASEGLRMLSQEAPSIPHMSQHNPVPLLIEIILDAEFSEEQRCNVGTTLNAVVKTVPACALVFSRKDNFEKVRKLLERPLEMEEECLSQVLEAMSTVLSFPTHISPLIGVNFIKTLLEFLRKYSMKSPMLAIYAIEILSWLLYREAGRDLVIACGGVNDVVKILYRSKDSKLLNALGLFLMVAFKDQLLSECFIRAGIETWLLVSRELSKTCPNLASATELLFSKQLSLKLEYVGRLDVWDKTHDGFYVLRSLEMSEDFPLLGDLLEDKSLTDKTVYYLSMGLTSTAPHQREDAVSMFDIGSPNLGIEPSEDSKDLQTKPEYSFSSYLEYAKLLHLSKLTVDTRLKKILQDIQMELQSCAHTGSILNRSCSEKFHREWNETRARVIGEKVAEAMSGSNDHEECTYHTFNLHLKQLKKELGTGVIPIGALEVGLKLERALLFKILADRLELPCALVRGEYGIGWVELAIPEHRSEGYKDLPLRQLVTTHLVDLMDDPGHLVPLESEYAANYCGYPRSSLLERFVNKPHTLRHGRPEDSCKARQLFHIEIE